MDKQVQTIQWLRASLPRQAHKTSPTQLLSPALAELHPGLFLGAVGLSLLAGLLAGRLAIPFTATFCAAPLPLFLLYFRYFWRNEPQMRQLEHTFRFSFHQMCLARFTVLFGCTAAALLALCLTAAWNGPSPLSLALCGASAAALLGGALLLLSLGIRTASLGLLGGTLWMGLCTPLVGLRLETWLATLPLWGWLIPIGLGAALAAIGMKGVRYVCTEG